MSATDLKDSNQIWPLSLVVWQDCEVTALPDQRKTPKTAKGLLVMSLAWFERGWLRDSEMASISGLLVAMVTILGLAIQRWLAVFKLERPTDHTGTSVYSECRNEHSQKDNFLLVAMVTDEGSAATALRDHNLRFQDLFLISNRDSKANKGHPSDQVHSKLISKFFFIVIK